MKRRLLSLLVCLCMALTLLPTTAWAMFAFSVKAQPTKENNYTFEVEYSDAGATVSYQWYKKTDTATTYTLVAENPGENELATVTGEFTAATYVDDHWEAEIDGTTYEFVVYYPALPGDVVSVTIPFSINMQSIDIVGGSGDYVRKGDYATLTTTYGGSNLIGIGGEVSDTSFTATITVTRQWETLADETGAALQTRDAGEYFCVATAEKDGEVQASETSETVTVEAPVARLDYTESGAAKTADLAEREVRYDRVSDYLSSADTSAGATLTLLANSAAKLSFDIPVTLTSGEGGPYTISRDMINDSHSKRGDLLTASSDCTVTNLTLDGTVPPVPPENTEMPSFVKVSSDLTLGEGATIQNCQPNKEFGGPALPDAAVDVWGSLTMTDGSAIIDNQGGGYGGVVVEETVTLSGAVTIKDNVAVDLTGIYSFDQVDNAPRTPANLLVFAPDPDPTTSATAPIQVVGSLQGSEIGVTLLDYNTDKPTTGKLAQGSGYTLQDTDAAVFFSDQPGYFLDLNSEENAIYLEAYAITQQPTADNGYTVAATGEPTLYQWYPATVDTQAVTDQNTTQGRFACTYADGKWTAGEDDYGSGGYFTMALKEGDRVAVTIPTAAVPTYGQLGFYDRDTRTQVWYYFDGGNGDASATTDGDNTIITYAIPADGIYALTPDGLDSDALPSLSATVTGIKLGDAIDDQTTATLTSGQVGQSYLCTILWSDGTYLDSDVVTFTAPPHVHAMSVDCSATEGTQVTYAPLTLNESGVLCVSGAALTPDAYGSYTLPAGSYYLAEDITITGSLTILDANDAPVNLCLGGNALDLGTSYINVRTTYNQGNGVLNVCDCSEKESGLITSAMEGSDSQGTVYVANQFSLYGGTVLNTCDKANNALCLNAGTANLYSGKLISGSGNGLWVSTWQADGLNLSGTVTIRGGSDQDVYFTWPSSTWENNAHFTLTGPLTKPAAPWRVALAEDKPIPLVDGWATHMGDADFADYFVSATKGLFVGLNAEGGLDMRALAITQQPSAANSYTAAANGAPACPPAYQWYPATVTTADVTTDNATVYTDEDETATYDPATKLWSGVGWMEYSYFTIHLTKGDVVTVKPTEALSGNTRLGLEPKPYNSNNTVRLYGSDANEAGEYLLTAPADGDYIFYCESGRRSADSDGVPLFSAKLTHIELGDALDGQNKAQLTATQSGDYLCRVTWADGTAINSDIVAYTPPHAHDWGKWTLQSDNETLKRVCAGDASHTESQTLSCGLPNAAIVYDGTEKKPAPSLKADGSIGSLTKGTDYTVAYKNNVNAGTATVTITGMGNFDFTLEKTFTIQKADQAAPAGIFHITDAAYVESSGVIAITTDASNLEYRLKPTDDAEAAWTQAERSNTLPAGTYEFRYKATDNYNASPATQVQVRIESPNAKGLTIAQGIEHGTVEKRRDKVNPGDMVTLAVMPDDGYALASIAATYHDGTAAQTIIPTVKPDNPQQYTFTMPNADVTVTATFTAVTPPDDGEAKGEVEVKPDTPAVSVDEDALKDLAGEVQAGETVTVKLTVEKLDQPEDKAELDEVITGKADDVLYLDLALLKQVNDGQPQAITDAAKVLEIAVPYDFTGKKDVTVYRKHGESDPETLTKLAARPTEDFADGSFYADSANGVIYIYASKFSTYAIGYTETTTPNRPSRPSGRPGTVGTTGTAPAWPFVDVKTTDSFYQAVKYVYEKGWMVGTSDTTFTPDGELTRAMLATVLYRMAGSPKVTGAPEFEDTLTGAWYSDAIVWASQTQVLRGYGNGKFGPEDPVSREMLNMVAARQQGQDPTWTGDPALALPATRAEIATVLMEQDKK